MLSPFVELRRQLHQIPEPGFQEFKTQQLLLDQLAKLPQDRLTIRTWRTGILVYIKGKPDANASVIARIWTGCRLRKRPLFPFLPASRLHACVRT